MDEGIDNIFRDPVTEILLVLFAVSENNKAVSFLFFRNLHVSDF